MRSIQIMLVTAFSCALTAFLPGCRTAELDVVLGPPKQMSELEEEIEGASDEWDELASAAEWEDERLKPRFLPRRVARRAPRLTLKDEDGRQIQKDISGIDEIVIVVFWSLDSWITTSALLHADYLTRNYADYGVSGVAIVENPESYHRAPELLSTHQVELDNFYDDFSALRRMSSAAGRNIESALPCFFLIDSNNRVRFSKLGFDPAGVADEVRGEEGMDILENAPRNQRIEDYLRRLIAEMMEQR